MAKREPNDPPATGGLTRSPAAPRAVLPPPRGGRGRPTLRRRFSWNRVLWSLIYPRRKQRIAPTMSGALLIGLSFGVGAAAYNASNNILFITLSLQLACLVLSGVLSWMNFRGVTWTLEVIPPVRAGHEALVSLKIANHKKVLPTYGLCFEFLARAVACEQDALPETTFTAKGTVVRAALAQSDRTEARGKLYLQNRLDPEGDAKLEWIFKPPHRGRLRIELDSVGALFPFGFLRKQIAAELHEDVIVWPAPVEYRRLAGASARKTVGGNRMARAGSGSDLFALRRYQAGDSHRLIHWKASARTRQLQVRQFAAESTDGYALWVQTEAGGWTRPEQFELLISLAATLAEDLFRAGKLSTVAMNTEGPVAIRRVRDLEGFLDRLAVARLVPAERNGEAAAPPRRKNLITFAPDGPRGVAAYVEGQKLAAA